MNQKIYTFLVFFLSVFISHSAIGQTTVTITDGDLSNGTHTWTNDNVYLLDGLVFLEEGGILTIQAGTVIKGKKDVTTGDNTSALIITRGAKIFAEGTANNPIIFTAEEDDVNDPDDRGALDRGLWGGLIILGKGVIARPGGEDGIEGIDADEPRAKYGGTDNEDNSGILKYVSIRHGGAALSPNNEINGLTLGGVGSKTVVEHIEVFANFDDGIEWFGGAVNAKWITAAFCGDDGMDYDFGWRGYGQFWFVIHGEGPLEAGRGGEHDGAKPDGENPFSQPTIYNATYIGSGVNPGNLPTGDENDFALVFRDRAGGFYWNSIFTEYPDKALSVEDLPAADGDDTYTNWQNGDLALVGNIWFGFGGDLGNGLTDLVETGTAASETDIINTLVTNGNTLDVDPNLAGVSRMPNGGLDPRPNGGSPALTTNNVPTGDFFDKVSYRGAFGSTNWLEGWTALSANGYLGDLVTPATGSTLTIRDGDLIGDETYVWTKENTYILDGLVFLEEGGKLFIEAGTVIKGIKDVTTGDNTSALIITRGAQIYAEGTADAPIIFTAEEDDINDPNDRGALDRGLWGGLIVLGKGIIARPGGEDGIEGIDADEARAKYGGTDNEDNSGILKYISIRHGGAALSPNNEINGLTLGGVGNKTTVEHIEVFANFDDGIEWFGGAVNCKWLSVAFCGDDGMDYDFGYSGNGQFWFVMHGEGPLEAGRGGEHDGAKPDGESPFSKPTIYNATYIGSGVNPGNLPTGDENDFALVFRDRAGGFYWNSIFTEYPDKALSVEDLPAADGDDTYTNWQNGDLALVNNFWFGFGGDQGNGLNDLVETGTAASETDIINTLVANGNQLGVDPLLAGISRNPDGQLDPRLVFGSPALNSAIKAEGDFFMPVSYNGAFGDEDLWLEGWTALDEYGYLGDLISSTYEVEKEAEGYIFRLPTPVPAKTEIIASFDLPSAGNISMQMFDLSGRIVQSVLNNQRYPQGEFNQRVNVSTLPNGTYILMLQTDTVRMAHKVIVQR